MLSAYLTVLDGLVVGRARVSVVEDRPAVAGARDASVADVADAARVVAVVEEHRLALVLLDMKRRYFKNTNENRETEGKLAFIPGLIFLMTTLCASEETFVM